MFPVEVRIPERDEDALPTRMAAMREWLDHHRFEPSAFRHNFTSPGISFGVDFSVETQAAMFAREFGGRVIGALAEMSSEAAAD